MLNKLILPLLFFASGLKGQELLLDTVPIDQCIPKELFERLNQLSHANIYQGAAWADEYLFNTTSIKNEFMTGVALFLKNDLGLTVALSPKQLKQFEQVEESSWTQVSFTGEFKSDAFEQGGVIRVSITFSFCDGSRYTVHLRDYPAVEETEHYELLREKLRGRFNRT